METDLNYFNRRICLKNISAKRAYMKAYRGFHISKSLFIGIALSNYHAFQTKRNVVILKSSTQSSRCMMRAQHSPG